MCVSRKAQTGVVDREGHESLSIGKAGLKPRSRPSNMTLKTWQSSSIHESYTEN